ncbi:hypothetical protein GALMADRAFT_249491 [Galerina marginata CBS 339.88]|uniref:DUF6697 domain-containing protein n=1 Tax=Galerina marginata (strain CBS 339.88) TaxID=685588 RepID=A0A067SX11_GALM3|nr:hypothetical protein GALMADRAFT_249491 [Galerina marginata CBS 339.88]
MDLEPANEHDEEENQFLAKLRTKFARSRNEITTLQAHVLALERENLGLKRDVATVPELERENSKLKYENAELKLSLKRRETDLKDSQTLLGQYVLTTSRQEPAKTFGGISGCAELLPMLKRARSPSVELLECPPMPHKKFKEISGGPLESQIAPQMSPSLPGWEVVKKCAVVGLEANRISTSLEAKIDKDTIRREAGEESPNTIVSFNIISSLPSSLPKNLKADRLQAVMSHNDDEARVDSATLVTLSLPKHVPPTAVTSNTSQSMPSSTFKDLKGTYTQSNPQSKKEHDWKNTHTNDASCLHTETAVVFSNSLQLMTSSTPEDSNTPSLTPALTSQIPPPARAQSNQTSREDDTTVITKTEGVFRVLNEGQVILAAVSPSSQSMLGNPKQAGTLPNTATVEDRNRPNASSENLFTTPNYGSSIASGSPSISFLKEASAGEQTREDATPSTLTDMAKFYLKSSSTLTITPPPLDLDVPRAFLRVTYGGSDQHWLQFIPASRNPSGPHQRRIVFPKQELNPAMPTAPGEPGLIFASRHEILSNPPWMVFRKGPKAPAVWRYLGEYECVLCGTMTAEQFKNLTPEIKREWAKALLTTKAFNVYVAMRARIALRKGGAIPLEDKEDEKRRVEVEIEAIKRDKGQPVSVADIIAALSNNDEGIDIIRMTCVKYDHDFVNHMKVKLLDYQVKPKGKRPGGHSKALIVMKQLKKPTPNARLQGVSAVNGNADFAGHSDEEYMESLRERAGPSMSISVTPGSGLRRSARKSVVSFPFEDDSEDDPAFL